MGWTRWCYFDFPVLLFDTTTSEMTGTRQYWCITVFDFLVLLLDSIPAFSLRTKCQSVGALDGLDRPGRPARACEVR